MIEPPGVNERQRSHIDFYLKRLGYWEGRRPASSTAHLLAARNADEAHPLRSEEAPRPSSTCGGWSMSSPWRNCFI